MAFYRCSSSGGGNKKQLDAKYKVTFRGDISGTTCTFLNLKDKTSKSFNNASVQNKFVIYEDFELMYDSNGTFGSQYNWIIRMADKKHYIAVAENSGDVSYLYEHVTKSYNINSSYYFSPTNIEFVTITASS